MKGLLIAIIIAGLLMIAFILYNNRTSRLDVDPHAREQIEKAKGR